MLQPKACANVVHLRLFSSTRVCLNHTSLGTTTSRFWTCSTPPRTIGRTTLRTSPPATDSCWTPINSRTSADKRLRHGRSRWSSLRYRPLGNFRTTERYRYLGVPLVHVHDSSRLLLPTRLHQLRHNHCGGHRNRAAQHVRLRAVYAVPDDDQHTADACLDLWRIRRHIL